MPDVAEVGVSGVAVAVRSLTSLAVGVGSDDSGGAACACAGNGDGDAECDGEGVAEEEDAGDGAERGATYASAASCICMVLCGGDTVMIGRIDARLSVLRLDSNDPEPPPPPPPEVEVEDFCLRAARVFRFERTFALDGDPDPNADAEACWAFGGENWALVGENWALVGDHCALVGEMAPLCRLGL